MLNAIRNNFHHNWEPVAEDGIYGPKSARAVRGFQQYRGISSQNTPNGPVLGDTTIRYLKESYSNVPQLRAWSPTVVTPHKSESFNLMTFTSAIMDCISSFDAFIKNEMTYVDSLRLSNPKSLQQRYHSLVTMLDPRMKKLKEYLRSKKTLSNNKKRKDAKNIRKKILYDIKQYDIIGKIDKEVDKFLRSKGIKTDFDIKYNNKIVKNVKIKFSGIFTIWNFKDLIGDAIRINEWGTDKWKNDVKKHFYEMLDGLIIGIVSSLMAELAVVGVIAVTGLTISTGWIVAIIAIVATLLSVLFSYLLDATLLDATDISFAEISQQGYADVLAAIKY